MEQAYTNSMMDMLKFAETTYTKAKSTVVREEGSTAKSDSDFKKLMEREAKDAEGSAAPAKKQDPSQAAKAESAPAKDNTQTDADQNVVVVSANAAYFFQNPTADLSAAVTTESAAFSMQMFTPAQQQLMQSAANTQTLPQQAMQTAQMQVMQQPQQTLQNAQAQIMTPQQAQVTAQPQQAMQAAMSDNTGAAQQTVQQTPAEVTVKTDDAGNEAGKENAVFGEVKAAPIKVGESAVKPEASARTPDVESQVSKRLAAALQTGETKVEINLEPKYLGTVKIEITQANDGTLRILINAENAQTRSLLDNHALNLQSLLADRGQAVKVEVAQPQQSPQEDQTGQYNEEKEHSGREQEQREEKKQHSAEDFLQQLRLGLIPIAEQV